MRLTPTPQPHTHEEDRGRNIRGHFTLLVVLIPFHLCISLSPYVSLCVSLSLSVSVSLCFSVSPSVSVSLSVSVSACLPACLSVCLSLPPPLSLYIYKRLRERERGVYINTDLDVRRAPAARALFPRGSHRETAAVHVPCRPPHVEAPQLQEGSGSVDGALHEIPVRELPGGGGK